MKNDRTTIEPDVPRPQPEIPGKPEILPPETPRPAPQPRPQPSPTIPPAPTRER